MSIVEPDPYDFWCYVCKTWHNHKYNPCRSNFWNPLNKNKASMSNSDACGPGHVWGWMPVDPMRYGHKYGPWLFPDNIHDYNETTKEVESFMNDIPKIIKIKKNHPDAIMPARAHETDAGFDLVAIDDGKISKEYRYIEYDTGFSIELPDGYHAEIFPRSSVSKKDLWLANSVGIIDNGYRGSILLRFKRLDPPGEMGNYYKKGDRIGQLDFRKTENVTLEKVEDLNSSERDDGGFGSTGS